MCPKGKDFYGLRESGKAWKRKQYLIPDLKSSGLRGWEHQREHIPGLGSRTVQVDTKESGSTSLAA